MSEAERAARIEGYRRRYEELKHTGTTIAPTVWPAPTALNAASIAESDVITASTLPGGWYTTLLLARGQGLRLVNKDGKGAASLLAWNAKDPSERLNHADTIKVQWTTELRKGRVLFSDMGRVILSIIEDTSGHHDVLVGGSTAASIKERYGDDPSHRNTRDNLVLAAGKHGLGRADIAPVVTFFAPTVVGAHGEIGWNEAGRRPGDFVDLRAEMDLIVAVSACPHPMDPAPSYAPGDLGLIRFKAPPVSADDLCRTATQEARRGFDNLDDYLALQGA
ncbi:hypothetical protein SAMN07250955_108102 [Arboricoccus pini]|uniref:DUF1989 domain-containing protein n=1 Tax=Arboricoccus pini TaxID=1963835 RepID=A0A212RGA3_9PROT|nr:urea amidolyase associated protein UAAP1 [Arboricoccus pini]SNB71328.1 hypothetical protein SAMN07250955_108102 [Arboricoccus pini]